ncbi:MAG: S1 RNA-binding domain-containing protein [Candidatus Solibacter usitatus]|nr:S1 RNA-binding domain-containing protein [Candidatus Solibacter usitatus]
MNSLDSPHNLDATTPAEPAPQAAEESSFGDVLRQFEAEHHGAEGRDAVLEGTVVSVGEEAIVVDVGRKMEGILRPDTPGLPTGIVPGTTLMVNISGRTDDGYYTLSTIRVVQPRDFSGLQSAYESKSVIGGMVTEMVKGGLRVQVADGVHAFLPASRSGIREMADMPRLLGQQIECRITKLDVEDPDRPDVVVDRRGVMEEQAQAAKQAALAGLLEGIVVQGKVRSLTDFGAFVEIAPGIDGLLHVTDMSWQRVDKPSSLLSPGQTIEAKILKINRESRKISLGMKQLTPDPWTQTAAELKQGDRVRGKVVRLAEFGAFVEIAPGVDGLIHLSEMSWTKRVRRPSDILNEGEMVEAVVLDIKPGDKKISLGLKQALGNPWDDIETRFTPGTVVERPVTNLAQFGAFVDLGDGIEGMIHVGDITREARIQHPKERLSPGQVVKAVVLEADKEKRRIRLSMKQLEPTSADTFIGEHQVGELLTGRVVEVHTTHAKVELGEGVHARCKTREESSAAAESAAAKADVDDLAALLASRWKGGASAGASSGKEGLRTGQIRRFKITVMDAEHRRIEVESAD